MEMVPVVCSFFLSGTRDAQNQAEMQMLLWKGPEKTPTQTARLTSCPGGLKIGAMVKRAPFHIAMLSLLLSLSTMGCSDDETISEIWPPRIGTVTATVHSHLRVADLQPGIELPDGFQVRVRDGAGDPVVDATVRVWPGGRNPQTMPHDASGRYEIDALVTERIDSVETEYFFEVVSEWLDPQKVVLRVPHAPLTARPDLQAPVNRSEQTIGEDLDIHWNPVPGAECYDIGVREIEFLGNTTIRDCVTTTSATLSGEEARDFSFIRVRARHELGDVNLAMEPYFSAASADAEVEIYFVNP